MVYHQDFIEILWYQRNFKLSHRHLCSFRTVGAIISAYWLNQILFSVQPYQPLTLLLPKC